MRSSGSSSQKHVEPIDNVTETASLGHQLGLTSDILNKRPNELSVGQQQRIAVIRAMLGARAYSRRRTNLSLDPWLLRNLFQS